MRDEDVIDMQEAEEKHEAMDYMQHERTWETFTGLVKWAIIQLAFIVLGLFCIIEASAPVVGIVLILIGIVAPGAWALFAPKRLPT